VEERGADRETCGLFILWSNGSLGIRLYPHSESVSFSLQFPWCMRKRLANKVGRGSFYLVLHITPTSPAWLCRILSHTEHHLEISHYVQRVSSPNGRRGERADTSIAIADLRDTGLFSDMSSSVDEEEHSIEMHLPYIRHIFSEYVFSLPPLPLTLQIPLPSDPFRRDFPFREIANKVVGMIYVLSQS
jgi:hypothetical protein